LPDGSYLKAEDKVMEFPVSANDESLKKLAREQMKKGSK